MLWQPPTIQMLLTAFRRQQRSKLRFLLLLILENAVFQGLLSYVARTPIQLKLLCILFFSLDISDLLKNQHLVQLVNGFEHGTDNIMFIVYSQPCLMGSKTSNPIRAYRASALCLGCFHRQIASLFCNRSLSPISCTQQAVFECVACD